MLSTDGWCLYIYSSDASPDFKSAKPEPLRAAAVDKDTLWQAKRAADSRAITEPLSAAEHDLDPTCFVAYTWTTFWIDSAI